LLACRWNPLLALPLLGGLLLIDFVFFSANAIKVMQGGWFPIPIAIASFTTLATWRRGRQLLFREMGSLPMPMDEFMRTMATAPWSHGRNTAVYLTSRPEGAPSTLLRNAQSASDFFRIPTDRVMELGTLVEI
jgi:KUP system potassium uptake protein